MGSEYRGSELSDAADSPLGHTALLVHVRIGFVMVYMVRHVIVGGAENHYDCYDGSVMLSYIELEGVMRNQQSNGSMQKQIAKISKSIAPYQ